MKTNEVKKGIAELEEAAIARQWLSKRASLAVDTDATIEEPWEVVFSMRFMPSLCNEDQRRVCVLLYEFIVE